MVPLKRKRSERCLGVHLPNKLVRLVASTFYLICDQKLMTMKDGGPPSRQVVPLKHKHSEEFSRRHQPNKVACIAVQVITNSSLPD